MSKQVNIGRYQSNKTYKTTLADYDKQGPYANCIPAKEFFEGVKEAIDKGLFKWLRSPVDCVSSEKASYGERVVKFGPGHTRDECIGLFGCNFCNSSDKEEELARIFNRTDDKEELYKQVLELLRK